jgi:hypothetical protein
MCKIILIGFCILYALAMALWALGTFGWFGVEKDSLSGVFLIILGQPWVRWVDVLPETLWPAGGVLAPLINVAVIASICAYFTRS